MRVGIISLLLAATIASACGQEADTTTSPANAESAALSTETAQGLIPIHPINPIGPFSPWVPIGQVVYTGGWQSFNIPVATINAVELGLEGPSNCAPQVLAFIASVDALNPWPGFNPRVPLRLTNQWRNGFNVAGSFHFEGINLPPSLIVRGIELSVAPAPGTFARPCPLTIYGRR